MASRNRKILIALAAAAAACVAGVAWATWAGSRPSIAGCGQPRALAGAETYRAQAADGNCLQGYAWEPKASPVRAAAVLVHGLGDHPGRYAALVQALGEQGIAVLAQDLRGHGASGGERQRVDSVVQAVSDTEAALREAARRHPGVPLLLYGHSMGGLIAAQVAARDGEARSAGPRPALAGVVLSSAALALPASASEGARTVVGLLSRLAPGLPLEPLDLAQVVREPAARSALAADPAILRSKVPARTVATILDGVVDLQPRIPALNVPLLVLHGGADRITEPAGSRALVERAASKEKKLVVHDAALHSLLHEPEGAAVLREIVSFMNARAAPRS